LSIDDEDEVPAGKKDKKVKIAARQRLQDAIYTGKEPKTLVEDREALYDFARAYMGDVPVTYLEFGVRNARSMNRMMARFTNPQAMFYGFDSFVGLPEQWKQALPGTYTNHGNIPQTDDPRARYVKGWFQNSVPAFLEANDLSNGSPLLIRYDADLYSSTLFLLAMLWPRTTEYYFLYDEFLQEEVIAMHDFARGFPVEYEFFAQTSTSPFKQIFGRMKRVEFVPNW